MSIKPQSLFAPQPSTTRANALILSYDLKNDRIVYPQGKSVFVKAVDPKSELASIQFSKHLYLVTAATFAPNGNYVASGDESGNVKIWDVSIKKDEGITFEQPSIKSEFQILAGPIKSIAWDADSQRVIAVGEGKDKFGHCFTWDSGNSIGEIQGHSDTVNAVAIKPQRPYRAATVGVDKALVFYQGPPFKFDKSVRGHHTNTIRDVKFSPDGKYLVSVGSDRLIVVYDGKTGEYIKKIENAHDGGIFGISWVKDNVFATSSADNSVKTWDVEEAKEIKKYVVSETVTVADQQVGLVVTPKYLISLSGNGNLNYFEHDSTLPSFVISGVQNPITAVDLRGKELTIGSSDGSLVKVGLNDDSTFGSEPEAFGSHSNYISSILTESNSTTTITTGWDDTVKVWEGKERYTNSASLTGQPKKIIKLADSTFVILFESKLEAYSSKLEKIANVELPFTSSDIDFDENNILYLTNLKDNRLEIYSYSGEKFAPVKSYPSLRAVPVLIRVSPNGKYAAVSDSFGKYTLYNIEDGSVVTTRWAFHSSKVLDAAWTPDSKFIVSGGLDTGILIYSVARPAKVLKFLLAHQTGVSGLKWSSYDEEKKSATIVSTGLDGVVKLWLVDLSVY